MGFADRFEAEVSFHPFQHDLIRFRQQAGYPGRLFVAEPLAPPASAPPPPEERLAEIRALLDAPGRPRASRPFEAYCLALQLIAAVDNRYLGPFNPASSDAGRLGLPELTDAVELAAAPGTVAVPYRDHTLILDPSGALGFHPGRSADPPGSFQPLRCYVDQVACAAPPPRGTPKRERVARFLTLLAGAPRPATDLAAMATVSRLLTALEDRYFADGGQAGERRLGPALPFVLFVAPAFPGATLIFATGHALLYYPDGTLEIRECGPRSGLMLVRFSEPIARLGDRLS